MRSTLEQILRKIPFEIFLPLKFLDLSCCQCSVPYDGDMKDDVLKRVGISRTFEENALKVRCVINNKSDDKKTVRIRLEDSAVDH